MFVSSCANKLHIDVHLISRFLDTAFENVCDAKLMRDLGQIPRAGGVLLRRVVRDDLECADFCQSCQDLVLNADGEIGVGFIFA